MILPVSEAQKTYWAGKHPPSVHYYASDRLTASGYYFRELPHLHGRFDEVFATEYDLGMNKNWPVIIDELIRLLSFESGAHLILRVRETRTLSVFHLMNFFRSRFDLQVSLVEEKKYLDNTVILKLKVKRTTSSPTLNGIEFGLITNGARIDSIKAFVQSVLQLDQINSIDFGIAVCGPTESRDEISQIHPQVTYVDEPDEFKNLGWITRKKNLIVENTTRENVFIAHDRYILPVDFLTQVFAFGADFDVIVPTQFTTEGIRFPDKVALSSAWAWSPSLRLTLNDYHPYEYVNGGVIFAKSEILRICPWNELLFWNQGEDVELSRQLQKLGVVPRISQSVWVETNEVRDNYIESFYLAPYLPDEYPVIEHSTEFVAINSVHDLQGEYDLSGATPHDLFNIGFAFDETEWECSTSGLVCLTENAQIQIFPSAQHRELSLKFLHPVGAEIKSRGLNCSIEAKQGPRKKNQNTTFKITRNVAQLPCNIVLQNASGSLLQSLKAT